MSPEPYWVSKTVIVDWSLRKDDGTPAVGATVAGVFSRPNGTTAVGVVTDAGPGADGGRLYRIEYDVDVAGWWAYRLTATGAADAAEEGQFYVRPSLLGGPVNTYDPTTDAGRVRLLISDTDVHDPERCLYTDAEITAFLALNTGVKRAAAAALDAIASNLAMVLRVIKSQDLTTDGARTATALRAQAQALRDQADRDDDDQSGNVEVLDFDPWAAQRAWLALG